MVYYNNLISTQSGNCNRVFLLLISIFFPTQPHPYYKSYSSLISLRRIIKKPLLSLPPHLSILKTPPSHTCSTKNHSQSPRFTTAPPFSPLKMSFFALFISEISFFQKKYLQNILRSLGIILFYIQYREERPVTFPCVSLPAGVRFSFL